MKLPPDIAAGIKQYFNTGGPMSRTRRERVRSTLLGTDDGAIRCPRLVRVGLDCRDAEPVGLLMQLLHEEGFGNPEDLRDEFEIPDVRLVARPYADASGIVDVRDAARRNVLWSALVLGLCTPQLYDPARPVLWTQAALTRRLELFDPAGFYA